MNDVRHQNNIGSTSHFGWKSIQLNKRKHYLNRTNTPGKIMEKSGSYISRCFSLNQSVLFIYTRPFVGLNPFMHTKHFYNICTMRPNVFDVGPTLYKCFKNILYILVYIVADSGEHSIQAVYGFNTCCYHSSKYETLGQLWANAGQRRRQWFSISPSSGQCIVFAGVGGTCDDVC